MTNPITRRAAVIGAALTAALTLSTRNANAVTEDDTFHPNDLTAAKLGATTDGWVNQTGPTWDDQAAVFNTRDVEAREVLMHRHHRDGIDNLFTALAPPTSTMRIMCCGDSITLGAGSTSPGGQLDQYYLGTGPGYQPWLTSNLLRRRIRADITTVAQGGQTLRTMTGPILAALPTARPDIVIINLGTNDVGGANDYTPDWGTRYGSLLDQILAYSPTVKIVGTLIFSTDPNAGALNQTVKNAIQQRATRCTLADLTVVTDRWLLDRTHPGEGGYVATANTYTDAITRLTA